MKAFASQLAFFMRGKARQNLKVLVAYCLFLVFMMLFYAHLFQELMWRLEGREYSFIAGVYWTITVMTTLGFGDITFHTDPGYIFAGIVTLSGVLFLLILLPFMVVSLFVAPWIENQLRYRPAKRVPEETEGHVVICGLDPVTRALIRKLQTKGVPFVVATASYEEARRLDEEGGMRVVLGDPSEAEVLLKLRVEKARIIVANLGDAENTNIILTVRSLCSTTVVALADEPEHTRFLHLAGADKVIPLKKILGRFLATRGSTKGALAHILDSFGKLLIAEMPVHGTPFTGMPLQDAHISEQTGLAVVGVWQRGKLTIPGPSTILTDGTVMVVVGTREQLEKAQALTGERAEEDLVLIIGHGRIGCSAASYLDTRQVPFILIDKNPSPACTDHITVLGDATKRSMLKEADLDKAKGLIVTTNDDGTNIFLTLACRHINPNVRIVARASREENVDQLYTAGADFVVSSASVGSSILMNVLDNKESVLLSEGMHVFRHPVPPWMAGRTILATRIRSLTGSTIIALEEAGKKEPTLLPSPDAVLQQGMTLILIGSPEQEARFRELLRQ